MNFDCCIPTRIIFGAGRIIELGRIDLPGKKALIVTSGGSVKRLGYLDRVTGLLKDNGIACVLYDGVQPNPTKSGVMEAAAAATRDGCDFIVGLGGGSSIDTAKAVAVMMRNPGDLWDYAYAGTGKRQTITGAAPVVAVSTTAGTGTETDPWFVITNEQTGEKLDFSSQWSYPAVSVIDPELMVSVPAMYTAFQGMDALFHAAEGYLATIATPFSDIYALETIRLLADNLENAVRDGKDIKARENVAFAADVLAGFVQSLSSCVSLHILGQTMGGMFPNLPHGASLVAAAKEYFTLVSEKMPARFRGLAEAMGVRTGSMSDSEAADAFVEALDGFMKRCGVGDIGLSSYGIRKEDLKQAAATAKAVGFDYDGYQMSLEETEMVLEKSYR